MPSRFPLPPPNPHFPKLTADHKVGDVIVWDVYTRTITIPGENATFEVTGIGRQPQFGLYPTKPK